MFNSVMGSTDQSLINHSNIVMDFRYSLIYFVFKCNKRVAQVMQVNPFASITESFTGYEGREKHRKKQNWEEHEDGNETDAMQ